MQIKADLIKQIVELKKDNDNLIKILKKRKMKINY